MHWQSLSAKTARSARRFCSPASGCACCLLRPKIKRFMLCWQAKQNRTKRAPRRRARKSSFARGTARQDPIVCLRPDGAQTHDLQAGHNENRVELAQLPWHNGSHKRTQGGRHSLTFLPIPGRNEREHAAIRWLHEIRLNALGQVLGTLQNLGPSPASDFPRSLFLLLRQDLVQQHASTGLETGQLLGVVAPKSTADFGAALLNNCIANKHTAVNGVSFHAAGVFCDLCGITYLLLVLHTLQRTKGN